MEENIKVYVQVDSNNVISAINSSIFLTNTTGWVQIDEGQGDNFSHAQSNYLEKSLMSIDGRYNYKVVDGKVVELTEEEKDSLFPTVIPQPTVEEKQAELINNLILDNLNMQTQIDSLITSGLGGN